KIWPNRSRAERNHQMNKQELPTNESTKNMLSVRWGDALLSGFVVVPSVLLLKQRELCLRDGELVTLTNILMAWWDSDKKPFPGAAVIARRMGVNARTVHRHLNSLVKKGYISKEEGVSESDPTKKVVRYDMTGLVERLKLLSASMPHKRQTAMQNTVTMGATH
ncbi:MAG TPA: helix-turn-helix domain-containing protein, partial [Rhodocyclaceae bacterium]|nr:helix-turn-helix domain-containing protein [Rhodocyclaceae bacterium]